MPFNFHYVVRPGANARASLKAMRSLGTAVRQIWERQRPLCSPSGPVAPRAISGTGPWYNWPCRRWRSEGHTFVTEESIIKFESLKSEYLSKFKLTLPQKQWVYFGSPYFIQRFTRNSVWAVYFNLSRAKEKIPLKSIDTSNKTIVICERSPKQN